MDYATQYLSLGKSTGDGGPQMHDLIGRSSKTFQIINAGDENVFQAPVLQISQNLEPEWT